MTGGIISEEGHLGMIRCEAPRHQQDLRCVPLRIFVRNEEKITDTHAMSM